MLVYEPNSCHFRDALIFYSSLKSSLTGDDGKLSNSYGEDATSERTFHKLLYRFKNGDISPKGRHSGGEENVF